MKKSELKFDPHTSLKKSTTRTLFAAIFFWTYCGKYTIFMYIMIITFQPRDVNTNHMWTKEVFYCDFFKDAHVSNFNSDFYFSNIARWAIKRLNRIWYFILLQHIPRYQYHVCIRIASLLFRAKIVLDR